MNPLFHALLSLGFIFSPTPALASSISPLEYSTTTAPVIIEAYAVHYGIPAAPLLSTLRCESGLDSNAVGDFVKSVGTSFGLAQIHLPAHSEVTKEQALDPYFSINFAAYQFSIGNQHIWSCYNKLYGKNAP